MGKKRQKTRPIITRHASPVTHHGTKGRLILIVGGAASGKSTKALELAGTVAPRAFLATGQPLDDEMARRIRRHRSARGPGWDTAEVPVDLTDWFVKQGPRYQAIILDCLTLWLNNLREQRVPDAQVSRLTGELLQAMRRTNGRIVIVTNELGMGLVPMDAAARGFRDLAGSVNQQVAQEADEVHLVVSGLAVRIK